MSRPRGLRYSRDRFRLPRFPEPSRPERPEPYDGGDWSEYSDPEPLGWDDLKDMSNLIGGLLMFLAIVVFVIAISIQDVR